MRIANGSGAPPLTASAPAYVLLAILFLGAGCAGSGEKERSPVDAVESTLILDNSIQGHAARIGAVGTADYDPKLDYLLVIRPTLSADGAPWIPADMAQAMAELKKALPRDYRNKLKFWPEGSCGTGTQADSALVAWMAVYWSLHAPKGDFGPLPDVRADNWRSTVMGQRILDRLCADLEIRQMADTRVYPALGATDGARASGDALSELRARYGIVALRPMPSPPVACLFSAEGGPTDGLVAMGPVVDGCERLNAPYITFDTSDPDTVAFGCSVVHGEDKRRFIAQLMGANATDVVTALESSRLSGVFVSGPSGALSLVTKIAGFNYKIAFASRNPVRVTVERWQ